VIPSRFRHLKEAIEAMGFLGFFGKVKCDVLTPSQKNRTGQIIISDLIGGLMKFSS
jgi:hypothetical protein